LETPILFLIYNRPDHTAKVFEEIKKAKPAFLFVAADGPKGDVNGDNSKCQQARSILDDVNWKCEVKTLLRNENMGSKFGVSAAISWFFENVDEGIILEDDCLPDTTFFSFASSLLKYYRHDETIMHINGTNYLKRKKVVRDESYYFSNLCHPWGWATWKRSWQKYDLAMSGFEEFVRSGSLSFLSRDEKIVTQWINSLSGANANRILCWDYQWFYTVWKNRGWAITPAQNLITNIGFGPEGTFTRYSYSHIGNMKSYHMQNLIHPREKKICTQADDIALNLRYREAHPNLIDKVNFKMNLIFSK
jgi:hypothetical protein